MQLLSAASAILILSSALCAARDAKPPGRVVELEPPAMEAQEYEYTTPDGDQCVCTHESEPLSESGDCMEVAPAIDRKPYQQPYRRHGDADGRKFA